MRINKTFVIVAVLLLALAAGSFALVSYLRPGQWFARQQASTPSPQPEISGPQTYTVMSEEGKYPKFERITINPQKVQPGDTQYMTVVMRDDVGIEIALANIETDTATKTVPLAFKQASLLKTPLPENEGKVTLPPIVDEKAIRDLGFSKLPLPTGDREYIYEGSWVVQDTTSNTYRTQFWAKDFSGRENSVTIAWSDPCTPPAGGDWTLDGNCSISGVNGVDNGNYTNATYTLTINNGGTFVFNSGKTMTLTSGSIAIASGGQVRKTSLWMTDADSDNYPATTTQVAAGSAPTSGRRRYFMTTTSSTDCNDSNASVYILRNQCSSCNCVCRQTCSYCNCVGGCGTGCATGWNNPCVGYCWTTMPLEPCYGEYCPTTYCDTCCSDVCTV